jgi:hypothetical protein
MACRFRRFFHRLCHRIGDRNTPGRFSCIDRRCSNFERVLRRLERRCPLDRFALADILLRCHRRCRCHSGSFHRGHCTLCHSTRGRRRDSCRFCTGSPSSTGRRFRVCSPGRCRGCRRRGSRFRGRRWGCSFPGHRTGLRHRACFSALAWFPRTFRLGCSSWRRSGTCCSGCREWRCSSAGSSRLLQVPF